MSIRQIRKLRLRPGDIVVVRDMETAESLAKAGHGAFKFSVPIVVAPDGVKRLSAEYIRKLAAKIQ